MCDDGGQEREQWTLPSSTPMSAFWTLTLIAVYWTIGWVLRRYCTENSKLRQVTITCHSIISAV